MIFNTEYDSKMILSLQMIAELHQLKYDFEYPKLKNVKEWLAEIQELVILNKIDSKFAVNACKKLYDFTTNYELLKDYKENLCYLVNFFYYHLNHFKYFGADLSKAFDNIDINKFDEHNQKIQHIISGCQQEIIQDFNYNFRMLGDKVVQYKISSDNFEGYITHNNEKQKVKWLKLIARIKEEYPLINKIAKKKHCTEAFIEVATEDNKKIICYPPIFQRRDEATSYFSSWVRFATKQKVFAEPARNAFSAKNWQGGPHQIIDLDKTDQEKAEIYRDQFYNKIWKNLWVFFNSFLNRLLVDHPHIKHINIFEPGCGLANLGKVLAKEATEKGYDIKLVSLERDTDAVKKIQEQFQLCKDYLVIKSDIVNTAYDILNESSIQLKKENSINAFVLCGITTRDVMDGTVRGVIPLQQILKRLEPSILFLGGQAPLLFNNYIVRKMGYEIIVHSGNYMILIPNLQNSLKITKKILNADNKFCDLQLAADPITIIRQLDSSECKSITHIDLSYCSFGITLTEVQTTDALKTIQDELKKVISQKNFPNLNSLVFIRPEHSSTFDRNAEYNYYWKIIDAIAEELQIFCTNHGYQFISEPSKLAQFNKASMIKETPAISFLMQNRINHFWRNSHQTSEESSIQNSTDSNLRKIF